MTNTADVTDTVTRTNAVTGADTVDGTTRRSIR
jgi:hypothetical protein